MLPALFWFWLFGDRTSLFPRPSEPLILGFLLYVPPHPGFFLLPEMKSCKLLLPNWPGTVILSISASQVGRITGVSHWCLVESFCFFSFETGFYYVAQAGTPVLKQSSLLNLQNNRLPVLATMASRSIFIKYLEQCLGELHVYWFNTNQ
jgi:hypothetical protein